MLSTLSKILASFFGLGYFPWMPGTWGTMGALIVSFFFQDFSSLSLFLISIITTILGIYVSRICLKKESFKNTDPSWIVIDEVAGYFWAISFISIVHSLNFIILIVSFVFFRIFDITKPWPISWIDRSMSTSPKTAAIGIMFDDVIAGVLAAFFTLLGCGIIY